MTSSGLSGLQAGVRDAPRGNAERGDRARARRQGRENGEDGSKADAPQPVVITIDPAIQAAAESALAGEPLAAGARRDRRTDRPDPGRRIEARHRLRARARRCLPTRLDVQGDHVDCAAPSRQHGLHARAVPGRRSPSTAAMFTQLRRRRGGRARPRRRVPDRRATTRSSGSADKLPSDDAPEGRRVCTASGHKWSIGVPSYGGTFPKPNDRAELAASAIGQGRILASPMQMASVAAAVASGQWRQPTLTTKPAPKITATAPALDGGSRRRRCARSWRAWCSRAEPPRARDFPPGTCRQDRYRRVRQRQPAADARVVHRLPRQPRVRGDRRRRRSRRPASPPPSPPSSSNAL